MNLASLTRTALKAIFALGPDFIKDATYVRPTSFSPATGVTTSTEVTAAIKMLVINYQRRFLAFLDPNPPDEKILVRASELTGINSPSAGDYIIESSNAQRRDVLTALLDRTGEVWTFQTIRSLNQNWGDLTAHTISEDWGDLTAITDSDDWGTLFPI